MDNYLDLADTQSPREGKAWATVNGQRRELFEISSLKAQLDITVTGKNTLGRKMMQHKRGGIEGTGSATLYFANSQMLKETIAYISSGKHVPITVQGYNEDEQSSIGRQEVLLTNVIFKTVLLLNLDDGSDDPVTFDSDLTFDDVQLLSSFTTPTNF